MHIDAEQAARELGVAVRTRTLIPFCGAGVSLQADPAVPSAQEFLNNQHLSGLTWQDAASLLADQSRFRLTFNETFGDPAGEPRQPSEQHRLLACLDAPYYITTNYDVLLERALQSVRGNAGRAVGVMNASRHLSDAFSYQNLVIKLHGDVNEHELLVFSEHNYTDRLISPTAVDGFVRLLFATHTILFVGYSLEARHIRAMLHWEAKVGQATPRWKYLVVPSIDKKHEAVLNAMNVKPVVLGKKGKPFENMVRDFLVRLWEQREQQTTFTKLLEAPSRSRRALIREAILFRQSGDLDKADQCLSRVFDQPDGFLDYDSLSDLVWITVSVYDKYEKWDVLEALDKTLFAPLFHQNEGVLPHEVLVAIRSVYRASLAIAFSRAGRFERAVECARESVAWQCTSTASLDARVVSANSHVALALAALHLWATTQSPDLLLEAKEALARAERLLAADRHRHDPHQNHHLGRFFGTRAFLAIAMADAGVDEHPDHGLLDQDARSAHEPEGCRTKFGAIAGRYCEAAVQYWGARTAANEAERSKRLDRAQVLLELVDNSLDTRQAAAQLKVRLLLAGVEDQRRNSGPQPPDPDLGSSLGDYRSCVHGCLGQSISQMGLERWMLLPLN